MSRDILNVRYEEVPAIEVGITNKEPAPYGYGVRHLQVLIIFLSVSVIFIARGHMGITVVAMTNRPHKNNYTGTKTIVGKVNRVNESNTTVRKNLDYENGTLFDEEIEFNNETMSIKETVVVTNLTENTAYKTYDWPKSTQEVLLSSFFLGYCIMMFPSGLICQRFGGKLPIQIALFLNAVVSVLTPTLTAWGGWKAVSACRIIQGLSQAGCFPSIQTFIAEWAPQSERGRLLSYIYAGTTFGTIIAFQLGGILAASAWGWPSTFWTTGVICFVMFIVISIFGAATPSEHRFISVAEKNFIMNDSEDGAKRKFKVPWRAIITSKHAWASISTHVGSGMSFVFFFTQVPSYIHYILGINVKESGLLTSLPYMASVMTSIIYGLLSDYCTNRNIISTKNARRISNSLAQVGIAVCLLLVSFTKKVELAMACFILALAVHSGIHTGWMVNYIDLAPNYTGALMAFGNTLMNMGVLLLPVLVSNIVTDVTNQYQWRIMFIFTSVLAFVANAVFVMFMSADAQPWNDCDECETTDAKNDKHNTEGNANVSLKPDVNKE